MRKFLYKFYPEFIGLLVFVSYMFTIGHSVGENDSGELAMCQATLSIPHPTGYPLFVLIGFLFSKLPIPVSTILKLNILSAVWCALTVIVVIRICIIILNNFNLLLNPKGRFTHLVSDLNPSSKIIASIFAGLMLAYSATFWLQSTRVEVYSLQIFLTSLIILFTLKVYISYEKQPVENKYEALQIIKKWWLVFVLIGFGFANHMMTLYLIPATVVLYFYCTGISIRSIKSLLILFFITGLISLFFYLALMIRANMSPQWSFGDASNITRLIDHISAKKYEHSMLNISSTMNDQGSKLLKMLSFSFSNDNFSMGEFALSLFIGVTGIFLIFLMKKRIAIYFFLIIIFSIALAISYNIPDINEYFLVLFMIMSISTIISIVIFNKLISGRTDKKYRFVFALFILLLIQIKTNFKYADRSKTYIYEDFLKSSISVLPSNSILLTDDWAAFLSPGLYYQNVENFRKDVTMVSPYGINLHEWYKKFQKKDILNSNNVIIRKENIYVSFDVVNNLISKGNIFLPPKSKLIPEPFYYRLVFDDKYYPIDEKDLNIRINKNSNNEYESYVSTLFAFMLEQRIVYELNFNKLENASSLYKKLKINFNDYKMSPSTYLLLMKYGIFS